MERQLCWEGSKESEAESTELSCDLRRREIKTPSVLLNAFPTNPKAAFSHCRGKTAPRYHHWGSQPAGREHKLGNVGGAEEQHPVVEGTIGRAIN
jgi:hypothetical protein